MEKTHSTPVSYAINLVLIALLLWWVIVISSGITSRAQSSLFLQVGIYII